MEYRPALKLINSSGKRIQMPLRLSDDFAWQPNERIELQQPSCAPCNSSEPIPGWIVFNIDYCGNERCFETAWISKEFLEKYFTPISVKL